MGLKRVNMELIRGEKSRLTTFGKRKACLMKKASEFSTLCGVDACVIVLGPRRDDGTTGPLKVETWPPNPDEVRALIRKFKQTYRLKKTYTLDNYFSDKKKNANVEAAKLREKYLKAKYPAPAAWDDCLNTFSPDRLNELLAFLNRKIDLVGERRLRMVKASSMQANQSLQHHQPIPYNTILMNNEDAVMKMSRAHQDNINQLGWHYNNHHLPDNYAAQSSSFSSLSSLMMTVPTYSVPSFLHQGDQDNMSQLGWHYNNLLPDNYAAESSSFSCLSSLMPMPTYSLPSFLNQDEFQPPWQLQREDDNSNI